MRKKEGNKEQAILEAAVKIFAQCGYHQAKVTAIAEEAGVATGSVYLYYENKEALLLTIFDQLWSNYTETLRNTVKRTDLLPAEKIDAIIDHLFDLFIKNPSLALVFVNEHHHLLRDKRGNIAKHYENFMVLAEEIYREGKQKQLFSPEVDIKIFWNFITGGLRSVLRQWAQHPNTLSLDRIRDNVKRFIKYGVVNR